MPVAPPRSPERLLLMLGGAIVVIGGVRTTLLDFEALGVWTVHGLQRTLIGLTAIWLLFGVLRLARRVTDRSVSDRP